MNKNSFVNTGINMISKSFRFRITSNEIKDIVVINSLKNRDILMKGTSRKLSCQQRELLDFLGPLMTVGLPLM